MDDAFFNFSCAANIALEFDVTQNEFRTLFDIANGHDDDLLDVLHIPTIARNRIDMDLRAGITTISEFETCEEYVVDEFDCWMRESAFFEELH